MKSIAVRIPEVLARNVAGFQGERGREWLGRLPELVAEFAGRWELTLGEPFPGMFYNYLVRAVRADGTGAVLKLGVPGGPIGSEADALRAFDGRGCVRLLEADRDGGAMLLELIEPGRTLDEVEDDDRATRYAAGVMKRVRRPVPEGRSFVTVADWSRGLNRLRKKFGGGTGPFPERLVERAERLYAELLASVTGTFLLHGDLHHGNMLSARREPWLAIDPQGVVGAPGYEVPPFVRNNLSGSADPARLVGRRVCVLADELGLDRERVLNWARAEAVLSAWWHYEDDDPEWRRAIPLAEMIGSVRLTA
ncbi:MAG: phosphotransferase [candidate division WOR-3 bacterium]|nr:MAG: phosphotransferase [candidate division WOR-3 bacterium]